MSVEIQGMDELEHLLVEKIPAAVNRALEPAATAALGPMLRIASAKAPRGDDGPPVLAESMVTETKERAASVAVVEGGPSSDVWYAHFPEFGTKHAPAQPYLRPGFDEGRQDAIAVAFEGVARAVEGAVA